MIIRTAILASSMAAALLLTGCSTIVNGKQQVIHMQSKPGHAQVKVDHKAVGTTPVSVTLARNEDHTVEVSLPGYATTQFVLTRKISGWFFGNILLGGFIGIAVDAATGSMYVLTPHELEQYAKTTNIRYKDSKNQLTIIMVRNADASWRKLS